jgi:hypothetical protein
VSIFKISKRWIFVDRNWFLGENKSKPIKNKKLILKRTKGVRAHFYLF